MHYSYSVRFAWDPKKAESNLRKHKVSFEEAATIFADPLSVVHPDDAHPERSLIVGTSSQTRLLLCVHIVLEEEEVRIISARHTTKHERRDYEEGR
jgi:uncharacterized DUF497 family protein